MRSTCQTKRRQPKKAISGKRRKLKSWYVVWDIDIDAKDPLEAAQKAMEIIRDLDSTASIFQVWDELDGDPDKPGKKYLVDVGYDTPKYI
jgi:hypothetical protein